MKRAPAMSKAEKKQHEEEFRQICREKRVPFTTQRRVILQALLELGSHPTADEVYAAAIVRKAGVSRATVFRTLENLVQLGAVFKVSHMGTAVRYDGRVKTHHHFVCQRCNEIIDIASTGLDRIPMPDAGDLGFVVKDFRIQLSGLCRHCLKETEKTQ
jgi:Fe2+ or Zn2+ uptake regulation protein